MTSLYEEEIYECNRCQDSGFIEIMGGSDADDWGVIDIVRCGCQE